MTSQSKAHQILILWLSITAISVLWGSTFLFIKLLVVDIPPFALTAIRAGIAALALAIWVIFSKQPVSLSRIQLFHMIILGTFNGWLPDTLTAIAIVKIDSNQAGIINATNPIITALLAHFLMSDERLSWPKTIGIGVGFFGIFLLLNPANVLSGTSPLSAQLLMLAVATSYALGTIYGRWVRAFSATQLSLGQFIFAFVPAIAISAAIEPGWNLLSLTSNAVFVLIALGVFCAAIPNVLFLHLLKRFPATNVSTITYLMPIWSIILGLTILHESITLQTVFGCAAILFGVWLVNERTVAQ